MAKVTQGGSAEPGFRLRQPGCRIWLWPPQTGKWPHGCCLSSVTSWGWLNLSDFSQYRSMKTCQGNLCWLFKNKTKHLAAYFIKNGPSFLGMGNCITGYFQEPCGNHSVPFTWRVASHPPELFLKHVRLRKAVRMARRSLYWNEWITIIASEFWPPTTY